MRVLIVKLSSLGDVVHAMPVVHDMATAHAGAEIDWVCEPAFAPLVRRVAGVRRVVDCALRQWRRTWWTRATRQAWRAFRAELQAERYDAVIDLQGLTKSAVIARLAQGPSFGLANRTEGSSHERPARWLVDHPIRVEPHSHAVDRSRELAARALGYRVVGPPVYGMRANGPKLAERTLVFVHGTSRDDKLWPEANWIELGRRLAAEGLRIALPHAGSVEHERAGRLAQAIGEAAQVWPAMGLDALGERLAATHGAIGVDSGLSHIAVALDLPHVQVYNHPSAWRTGPVGHAHQRSVGGDHLADVDEVWQAWQAAWACRP